MRYLTPTEQDWFAFQREFVLESDVDFSPPSLVIQFIELQSFWIWRLRIVPDHESTTFSETRDQT